MGALDVCPFIPVQDVTVEECVEISKKFGARMAEELGVPVFLYGYASEKDYRKTMPQVNIRILIFTKKNFKSLISNINAQFFHLFELTMHTKLFTKLKFIRYAVENTKV